MKVELDPQVATMIQQHVETGRYTSASDVVRDAMKLLEGLEQRREALHEALAVGFDALDRGEVIEWTSATMDDLIRESEEMNQRGDAPNPDVCP